MSDRPPPGFSNVNPPPGFQVNGPQNHHNNQSNHSNESNRQQSRTRGGRGRRGRYVPPHLRHIAGPSKAENLDSFGSAPSSSTTIEYSYNETSDAKEDSESMCLICCEPITVFAIGTCNHDTVCAMCTLRMRKLYDEKDCCMCKTPLEKVYFTKRHDKNFEELGKEASANPRIASQVIPDSGIVVLDTDFYKKCMSLFEITCPKCDPPRRFNTVQALSQHVESAHNQYYCELCLQHRKVFLHEQQLYPSKSAINKHNEIGDPVLKLKPHPPCKYCNKLYYSDEELFRHCEDTHFKCFICERDNLLFHYFRDYDHLEEHFRVKHYLCPEKECLEKKFVVFKTELELQAHQVREHLRKKPNLSRAEAMAARTINLNFTVRRADRFGSGLDDPSASLTTEQIRSLDFASQQQEEAQRYYRTRGTRTTPAPPTARPAASPVFFPDDRRRQDLEDRTIDTGFSLSDRVEQPKPAASAAASAAAVAPEKSLAEKTKDFITKVKAFLGDDKYIDFRRVSANFKQGKLSVEAYYKHFVHTFGDTPQAHALFEEMIDIMPDPDKQAQLRFIHEKMKKLNEEFPSLNPNASDAARSVPRLSTWSAPPNTRESFPPLTSSRGSSAASTAASSAAPALSEEAFPSLQSTSSSSSAAAAPPPRGPALNSAWAAPPKVAGGRKKKGKTVLLRYG